MGPYIAIKTPLVRGWLPAEMTKDWDTNPDIRLDPDSIANVRISSCS